MSRNRPTSEFFVTYITTYLMLCRREEVRLDYTILSKDEYSKEPIIIKKVHDYIKELISHEIYGFFPQESEANWTLAFCENYHKIVGHAQLDVFARPGESARTQGYLATVVTLPEFRQKGVCGKMVSIVADWASLHGIVTVNVHNVAGLSGLKCYLSAFKKPTWNAHVEGSEGNDLRFSLSSLPSAHGGGTSRSRSRRFAPALGPTRSRSPAARRMPDIARRRPQPRLDRSNACPELRSPRTKPRV